MTNYFVPYSGKKPVSLNVNGHKLILLATDKESIESELPEVGGDRLKVFKVGESEVEKEKFLTDFAFKNEAGVVIVPSEISPKDLLKNLESQLPWLH